MTFDSAGAYAVVRWDTLHLICRSALTALSSCRFDATDAIDWRHCHTRNVASIIQQGQPNGMTGAVVSR